MPKKKKQENSSSPTPKDPAQVPSGYAAVLEDIKQRIRTAQIKASLSVNRELIKLYWSIGKTIVERQTAKGWGKAVVDRLAKDIQQEFPTTGGWSPSNVWRMRAFFLAWTEEVLAQPARELEGEHLKQAASELDGKNLPQAVSEIPWFHNVEIIQKIKDPVERLWYVRKTITNGWSRSVLLHWIDSDLYSRQGKAITSFDTALPAPESDLAREILKDPYNFDFLTLHDQASEKELEEGLIQHIRKFLLELGAGFAFVGQQVPLEVDGEDFYIDLLFYHLHLRCYLVIELKAGPFKPEYAGKMNFYLSAVDDLLRHPDDKPSIGIILCKTRSKIIAEYALRDLAKPVGVAQYITKLVESLPEDLKEELPSVEQIETELSSDLKPCRTQKKTKK